MSHTTLLIDFENVRDIALASLPQEYRVCVFVGRSQHSIPFEIVRDAQQLGERLRWVKIEGDGHNNLDFHLAYHLGRLAEENAEGRFLVLSKDKGFDPLIAHIVHSGVKCERIESLPGVPALPDHTADLNLTKVLKVIYGLGASRPRKLKSLNAVITSSFQSRLPENEVRRIVDRMFARNFITESEGALSYHFGSESPVRPQIRSCLCNAEMDPF